MQTNFLDNNRGFLYGDALFETIKIVDNKVLFAEDHYFRLMASMRILRMEIPMDFTLEFFESQLLEKAAALQLQNSARARMTVYRNDGGYYLPETNSISFHIHLSEIANPMYTVPSSPYEVDIYKDFSIAKQLLSTIKSTNRLINITGSIFAKENDLDSCILLNTDKNVVEALHGNLFLWKDNELQTPALSEGCINGIMRKQILQMAKEMGYQVVEKTISPFDLQKAEEIFITNVIKGIQPITKYRKKEFQTNISKELTQKLNIKIRLS